MRRRPLPPYGRQYLDQRPSSGVWIACGPGAWDFTKRKPFPVMVLPQNSQPTDFRWPAHPGGAVIFECGELNDDRLRSMAAELIYSGSPFVVAIREALLCCDPRHFFYPEANNAAA